MSSKRRIRRKSCQGKVRHLTLGGAHAALRMMMKAKRDGAAMSAYECRFCNGFHVGHTPGANPGPRS